jgi:hypothetical protein
MKYVPLILPNDSFMVKFSPFWAKNILERKNTLLQVPYFFRKENGIKNFHQNLPQLQLLIA